MAFLVVGDLDQIQSYVFGSSRLRAIRGASALLEKAAEDFETDEKKRYGEGIKFLRRRGGQVVAILNVDGAASTADQKKEADEFCARLEAYVRRATAGAASITTAFVGYDPAKFPEQLKEAFWQIHEEKDGRQKFGVDNTALLTSPYYHRCSLLPTQPASTRERVGDEEERERRFLSLAAEARWNAVEDIDLDKKLLAKLKELLGELHISRLPYQLDDLWDKNKEEESGYMGYIAADGNSVGQMLEVIPNGDLYKKFSDDLNELVLKAIAAAAKDINLHEEGIERLREDGTLRIYMPLIPVIIAGDDISLLVRAEHALPLAEHLCHYFAEFSKGYDSIQRVIDQFCGDEAYRAAARQIFPRRFKDGELKPKTDETWKTPQPLTLSVGVAIAKRNFPISVYRRLAGELRDAAKRKLRSLDQKMQPDGMIDFAVITTATVQALTDLRAYYRPLDAPHLTMRPYTLEGMRRLKRLAESLQKIPRSKRKFLYAKLFSDHASGQAAYEFVLARASAQEIEKAMQEFGCHPRKAFSREEGKQGTPLIDALEMAELLAEEEASEVR